MTSMYLSGKGARGSSLTRSVCGMSQRWIIGGLVDDATDSKAYQSTSLLLRC